LQITFLVSLFIPSIKISAAGAAASASSSSILILLLLASYSATLGICMQGARAAKDYPINTALR